MKNQEIEVIVNTPDEEILQEMMAKAIASIIIDRINELSGKNVKLVVDKIIKDGKCE